jgi:hypothetical protein
MKAHYEGPGFQVTLSGIGLYTFVAIHGLSIEVRLIVYYPKSKFHLSLSSHNSWSLASLRADLVSKPPKDSSMFK